MTRFRRPALQSVICDTYEQNPRWPEIGQSKLIRCRRHYTTTITYQTPNEVVTSRCCDEHAELLRALKDKGRIEILSDESRELSEAA